MQMAIVRESKRLLRSAAQVAAILAVVAGALSACGKGDPEENFRLWMNNEAGWAEMAGYVADKGNDTKTRVRALEILVAEGGQPSQVQAVVEKAPDKIELLIGLQPAMFKLLSDGNPKKQAHGKKVLFDMIKDASMPAPKVAELKAQLSKWAFGDLSPDDPLERVRDRLKDRVNPDEILLLGVDAVPGAEIMLSKGLAKGEILALLKSMKTPEANKAIVRGLRYFHANTKNVKITEDDLGAVQGTNSLEGFVYFLELYLNKIILAKPNEKIHPDDKRAGELAVRAALEWADPDDKKVGEVNKKAIKAGWAQVAPVLEKYLTSSNCDDRWWALQLFAANAGLEGFKTAMAKMPDDDLYGKGPPHGDNDVQKLLVDTCKNEIIGIGADAVRPELVRMLTASPRLIDRIVASRCLAVLGDAASVTALRNFDKKDPMGIKNVQAIINVEAPLSLVDLVQAAVDVADYVAQVQKLASEGKIDAETSKWRQFFATYSFERKAKVLGPWAENEAKEKVEKDKAKKAAKPEAAPPAK